MRLFFFFFSPENNRADKHISSINDLHYSLGLLLLYCCLLYIEKVAGRKKGVIYGMFQSAGSFIYPQQESRASLVQETHKCADFHKQKK
jgi:hypothetical protein